MVQLIVTVNTVTFVNFEEVSFVNTVNWRKLVITEERVNTVNWRKLLITEKRVGVEEPVTINFDNTVNKVNWRKLVITVVVVNFEEFNFLCGIERKWG
jgi:hypothetical protein